MKRTTEDLVPQTVSSEGTLKEAMDSVPPPVSRLRKKLKRHGDGLGHRLGERASAMTNGTSVCGTL